MPTMSTERFVYLRNLKLLRAKLMSTTDEAKSQTIVKLMEDENGSTARQRAITHKDEDRNRSIIKARNVPRPAHS